MRTGRRNDARRRESETPGRTSCGAVVANDREQVVGGDLRRALLGQEGLHVQALQREGHVAADLEGVHHLVPEALQVNAENLHQKKQTSEQLIIEVHSWKARGQYYEEVPLGA